ncbi:MAG: hypothetical protein WEB87_04380 [Bacteriovoracaceae bacterium]
MDNIYFLVRFTPFWAVPLALIAAEFSYIFWIRKKKKRVFACLVLTFFALGCLVFYYWAGGPEKSVEFLIDVIHFFTR